MLLRALSVGVVLVATSGATALPFTAFSISAGGPGIGGLPVSVTNGIIRQDPNGGDSPPSTTQIAAFPSVEYDSYVALDSFRPSSPVYTAAAAMIFSPPYLITGQLSGRWGSLMGVASSISEFAPGESVFVSRLVVSAGADVSGPMMVGEVTDETGQRSVQSPLILVGPGAQAGLRGGGAEYQFFAKKGISPFAMAGDDRGGSFDVYDIYLVREIPAPGAIGLFGFGVLTLVRRRR